MQLEGSLALRPLEPGDADELYALTERERSHLVRWMPWAEQPGLEQTRAFLEHAQAQRERGDGDQWAITDGGRIIGTIGLHGIDRHNLSTSIGYWLAAGYQGRGIMTMAVRAALARVFEIEKLHRVEIRAAVDNARSRALAERLGFAHEGVAREAERFSDRYADLAVYALLEDRYRG